MWKNICGRIHFGAQVISVLLPGPYPWRQSGLILKGSVLMSTNENTLNPASTERRFIPQPTHVGRGFLASIFINTVKQRLKECLRRNQYINLAREKGASKPGIRPNTNKFIRFNSVVPWFKMHKFYFPEELQDDSRMVEAIEEITLVSPSGFLSRHDDFLDTISMLSKMNLWKPNVETKIQLEPNNVYSINRFDDDDDYESGYSTYIV